MTPMEAVNVLDQVAESIPMVDSDDELISRSITQLASSVNGVQGIESQLLQESLVRLDHMVKSVPLVRQSRSLVREAINVLSLHVQNVAAAEQEPRDLKDLESVAPAKAQRKRSRTK